MKIALAYKGKRLINNKRIAHCFEDKDGKELFFSKADGVEIGEFYEATKTKDSISMEVIPKKLEYQHDFKVLDDEKCFVEEMLDINKFKRIRASKKFAENSDLIKKVRDLKRYTSGMTFAQFREFSDFVCDVLSEDARRLQDNALRNFAKKLRGKK